MSQVEHTHRETIGLQEAMVFVNSEEIGQQNVLRKGLTMNLLFTMFVQAFAAPVQVEQLLRHQ